MLYILLSQWIMFRNDIFIDRSVINALSKTIIIDN